MDISKFSVSVIIPVFNTERFISKAIKSVLDQSLGPHEIIVINDGSTDNSREAINEHIDSIIFIEQENQGASAARNNGMKIAKGNYIAFLDADDIWEKDKLLITFHALEKLDNYKLGIIFSDFDRYDLIKNKKYPKTNNQIYSHLFRYVTDIKKPYYYIKQNDLFKLLLRKYDISPCTLVIKRELLGKIQWPEGRDLCEDLLFNLRCSRFSDAVYIDNVLTHVMRHDDNISLNVSILPDQDLEVLNEALDSGEFNQNEVEIIRYYYGRRLCGRGYSMRKEGKTIKALRYYRQALEYPGQMAEVLKGVTLTLLSIPFSLTDR